MPKLKDLLGRTPPKILMMGSAGTGKTTLVTTLGKDLALLDLDRKLRSVINQADAFADDRLEVNVIEAHEDTVTGGVPVAFRKARAALDAISAKCASGAYPYKVFAIDSFTSLAQACAMMVAGTDLTRKLSWNDWGTMTRELEAFLYDLRCLPIPTIVIAHEMYMEIDGANKVVISCPGQKLPPKLPAMFDEFWQTRVINVQGGGTKYVVRTRSTESVGCLSSHNVPDNYLQSDGLKKIFKKMDWDLDTQPKTLDKE